MKWRNQYYSALRGEILDRFQFGCELKRMQIECFVVDLTIVIEVYN